MSRVCVRPSVMLVMMRVSVCSVEQSGRWWLWWWWWGRITLGIGFAVVVAVARNSSGGDHTQSFFENLHDGIMQRSEIK